MTSRNGDPGGCVLLDGSAVYGSTRADGWLDVMRRVACPIGPAFVLVDVLAVKAGRTPLVLSGGSYNGPSFDEGTTAHSRLHLEEYFHAISAAVVSSTGTAMTAGAHTVSSGATVGGAELPFDTPDNPREQSCSHVDVSIQGDSLGRANAAVLLQPRCGILKGRGPDGLGLVGGFATGGGQFVYDGLIISEDRYHQLEERRRRFRFVRMEALASMAM